MIYFRPPKRSSVRVKVKKEWIDVPMDKYIESVKGNSRYFSPSLTEECALITLKSYEDAYPEFKHTIKEL